MLINLEKVSKDIEGLRNPKGNLVLLIACTDCETFYEINKESVAMAALTNASFLEYVNFVQNSYCTKCHPKDNVEE